MQGKVATISSFSIATVLSTSALALGLGVQAGAGLDVGVQAGARSAASAATRVPAQIELQAPVQHSAAASASADTEVKTNSSVADQKRSGEVARSAIRAGAETSREATGSINARSANKGAMERSKRTDVGAAANMRADDRGYHAAPPDNSVETRTSTKVQVFGS